MCLRDLGRRLAVSAYLALAVSGTAAEKEPTTTAEEGAAAAVVLGLLWNSWSISLAPDWLEILLLEVTTGWQLPLESQCCDWLSWICSLAETCSWIVISPNNY